MEKIGLKTANLLKEIEKCIKEDVSQTILATQPLNAIYTLAALYEKDKQRASDLAKAAQQPSTSFTPVLDRLEVAALITRSPHPDDRRAVIISLTKEGKKLQTVVENAIGNAEVRYGGK